MHSEGLPYLLIKIPINKILPNLLLLLRNLESLVLKNSIPLQLSLYIVSLFLLAFQGEDSFNFLEFLTGLGGFCNFHL